MFFDQGVGASRPVETQKFDFKLVSGPQLSAHSNFAVKNHGGATFIAARFESWGLPKSSVRQSLGNRHEASLGPIGTEIAQEKRERAVDP
jgi:hypothetical protein